MRSKNKSLGAEIEMDGWVRERIHMDLLRETGKRLDHVREQYKIRQVVARRDGYFEVLSVVDVSMHPDGGVVVIVDIPTRSEAASVASRLARSVMPHGRRERR